MDREQFISDIMSELRSRQANDTFNYNTESDPICVHRKLCYDYPDVSNDQISSLVKAFSTSVNSCLFKSILHPKFIDNLVSFSTGSSKDLCAKNIGALCVEIFICLPFELLSLNIQELNSLFQIATMQLDDECPSQQFYTWDEICEKYRSLCMSSTASMAIDAGLDYIRSRSCLSYILDFCHDCHPFLSPSTDVAVDISTSTVTLLQVLQSSSERTNYLKDIWLHCVFLVRDILAQLPVLLPSFIHRVVCVLFRIEKSTTTLPVGAQNTFPNQSECLLLLVLSSLSSASLTSDLFSEQPEDQRHDVNIVVTSLTPYLSTAANIADRMLKYGNPNEAAVCVCDLGLIFCLSSSGHDSLVASRLLHTAVSVYLSVRSLPVPAGREGSYWSAEAARLEDLFAGWAFADTRTAQFLSRFPQFLDVLLQQPAVSADPSLSIRLKVQRVTVVSALLAACGLGHAAPAELLETCLKEALSTCLQYLSGPSQSNNARGDSETCGVNEEQAEVREKRLKGERVTRFLPSLLRVLQFLGSEVARPGLAKLTTENVAMTSLLRDWVAAVDSSVMNLRGEGETTDKGSELAVFESVRIAVKCLSARLSGWSTSKND